MIKRLLAAKGIHYLVTRFGPRKLRSLAFDAKYESGEWCSQSDGKGELVSVIIHYLRRGNLLIMGCGGATVLEGLDTTALNSVLGIDLSEEAIRLASRFASDRISFRISDMEAFESPDSYDVILFSESLYYVPTSRQVTLLSRLTRHLKSGGVFVITFAQAQRYHDMINGIRTNFNVLDDHAFSGSDRHLIVFR